MKHWAEYVFVGLLALGPLVGGCGGNDPTVPRHTGRVSVEVRNGTWAYTETVSYTGADSCLSRPVSVVDTTDVFCRVFFGEGTGPFPVDCELDTSGTDVSFDCTVTVDLGYCREFIDLVGSGTVTDTTFDLRSTLFARIVAKDPKDQAQCDLNFGFAVDPCTTLVDFVGQWISYDDPDTICTIPDSTVTLDLRDVISGMSSAAVR